MKDAENRLQDRENYKVELERCMKCKRKDRLVNVKIGQAFCNVCRAIKLDILSEAQTSCAKLTAEELRTLTPDEIKEYEYKISDKYITHLLYDK